MVDLYRYHDLSQRLAAYSPAGGGYLSGDREDLTVVDGEPVLSAGEVEHCRVAGVVQLFGSRATDAPEPATLGLVLEGAGIIIVTSTRLIVMLTHGSSLLGEANEREVHTFVLPWDLVTSIAMPAKRSVADRVAGARTIELLAVLVAARLTISPAKRAEVGGREVRVGEDEVLRLLVGAGTSHRISVSPPEERARLEAIRAGARDRSDGKLVAWLDPPESDDIPPHLEGRLVQRNPEASGGVRELTHVEEAPAALHQRPPSEPAPIGAAADSDRNNPVEAPSVSVGMKPSDSARRGFLGRPAARVALGVGVAAIVAVLGLVLLNRSDEATDVEGGPSAPGQMASLLTVLPPDIGPRVPGDQGNEVLLTSLERAGEVVSNASLSGLLDDEEALEDELGINRAELTGEAALSGDQGTLLVMTGSFDEAAVATAVEGDPLWSDLLMSVEYAGVEYYSWGAENALNDVDRTSPIRGRAQSARFFVDEDRGVAYWTESTAAMEGALDTLVGNQPSLFDGLSGTYGAIAESLDDQGAYIAILSSELGLTREAVLQAWGIDWEGPTLARYEAVGTGTAMVNDASHLVLVLANEDSSTADENAQRLRTIVEEGHALTIGVEEGIGSAWSDLLEPGTISADGDLTVGSFPTDQSTGVDLQERLESLYLTD
jgi:hypothetical protein